VSRLQINPPSGTFPRIRRPYAPPAITLRGALVQHGPAPRLVSVSVTPAGGPTVIARGEWISWFVCVWRPIERSVRAMRGAL
jgi:hypothetical protein